MEEGICPSSELWPHQPRPGTLHRETWQKFLDQYCHIPTLKLKTPLGQWKEPIPFRWQAYYDCQMQAAVVKTDCNWKHYNTIVKQ